MAEEKKKNSIFRDAAALHLVALHAYERLRDRPGKTHYDALVAILFSAISVEAYINELFETALVYSKNNSDCTDTVRDFASALKEIEAERGSVSLKYLIAFRIFTGKSLDTGALLYQDFDLLLSLRNKLAHVRPLDGVFMDAETNTYDFYPAKILSELNSRCDFAHEGSVTSWLNRLETADVARWAVNAAARIVNALANATPADSQYLKMYTTLFQFRELD